jgi:MFS family permease
MLLVPVLPLLGDEIGGAPLAGAATGAFYFAAVAAQLAAPFVLLRLRPRGALVGSGALLGLPCLVHALEQESAATLVAVSVARGAGFGLAVVAAGTLLAEIAPAARRGTVIGYGGLAAGIPPVFAPALGAALVQSHATTVLIVAGVLGVAGSACAAALGDAPTSSRAARGRGVLRALLDVRLLAPLAWFGPVSVARGAAFTLAPVVLARDSAVAASAFLFSFGTAAFAARWAGGRLADRVGRAPIVAPSLAVGLLGFAILAASGAAAAAAVAAGLAGLANGALMTASQLDMLDRAGAAGFAAPTAAWNVTVDGGFGLGAVAAGALAAWAGYTNALWGLPALMAGALVVLAFLSRGGGPRAATSA